MLRILIDNVPYGTTVRLEGRLAGPWVDELTRTWEALLAVTDADSIRVDLAGVTFIDASGRTVLRRLHEAGAQLVARGCMTRAIVDEIRKGSERS